jgi:hypothetical protein
MDPQATRHPENPMRARVSSFSLILVLGLTGTAYGAPSLGLQITVEAGPHERTNTPVHADFLVPAEGSEWLAKAQAVVLAADGKKLPAQLAAPALLSPTDSPPKGMVRQTIWWVLPKLDAKQSAVFQATVTPATGAEATGFSWNDSAGKHADLVLGKRPVLRYMYQAYENDPAKRDLNNKPFHHLFDPTGQRLVTKGQGGFETHHQGLFFGFTSCTFEGGKCNTWYCHDGEHELHKKFVNQLAGPILGRQRMEIDWNDRQGKTFCTEEREMSAYAVPGGTLVEFASRLKSSKGEVILDGDPHHAGFQFRADDEISKRRKEVYFLRPTGKGNLGEEKNDKTTMNLPWNAMSFTLGDKRYTALYIDRPSNPKPAYYSERVYGRFGSALGKQTLKADGPPLELSYRIWLQEGEMMVEQANALATAFAEPAKVTAKVTKQEK